MAEGQRLPNAQSAEQQQQQDNNGTTTNNGHENLPNGVGENMEVDANEAGQAAETQPEERKITQTDHINKSLLTAFLGHLNNPSSSLQFPVTQRIDTDEDDDDEPTPIS